MAIIRDERRVFLTSARTTGKWISMEFRKRPQLQFPGAQSSHKNQLYIYILYKIYRARARARRVLARGPITALTEFLARINELRAVRVRVRPDAQKYRSAL